MALVSSMGAFQASGAVNVGVGGATGFATGGPPGAAVGAGLAIANEIARGGSTTFSGDWSKLTDAECKAMEDAQFVPSAKVAVREKCAERKKKPKKKATDAERLESYQKALDLLNFFNPKTPAQRATLPALKPKTAAQLAAETITVNVQKQLEQTVGGKITGKNSILLKSTNAGAAPSVDRGAAPAPVAAASNSWLAVGALGAAAIGALVLWSRSQKKRGQKGLF